MLESDEYFGKGFDLHLLEECASVNYGDEGDFQDLYVSIDQL